MRPQRSLAGLLCALLGACATVPAATPVPPASAEALAAAVARAPVVLLGEVHDNAVQHALRLEAVRRLLAGGARPALAFEQFDQDRQDALDRARAQTDGDIEARVARIVEAAGGRGWDWKLYRPYVALALQYDVPIVAANLSRARAMRVAMEGTAAVFEESERRALGLQDIAPELLQAQEAEIARGHCGRAPPAALAQMATAQIARDALLAQAILPFAGRGVVLFTGNGHVRRDIGVPAHLPPALAARTVAIGLLESGDAAHDNAPERFDVAFVTVAQERPDPCAALTMPHLER